MKIILGAHCDRLGGAARASFRLASALHNYNKIDTISLLTDISSGDDPFLCSQQSAQKRMANLIRYRLSESLSKLNMLNRCTTHSLNVLPSFNLKRINQQKADVVNLHWINREFLSIKEISKINAPVIMSLHDMWAFCGINHTVPFSDLRYQDGYPKGLLSSLFSLDLDNYVWALKKKYWKGLNIVTPSNWLTECVKKSDLFKDTPVTTIPNCLNTDTYKPIDKKLCRSILNLPEDSKIIGFGAIGGNSNPNKGFDVLTKALTLLDKDIECLVFGQSRKVEVAADKKFYSIGHLSDDYSLSLLYNCLDVMVVPSYIEAFGQTASEAVSCGVPVVAFNSTGLKDIVTHEQNGYLAKPGDHEDLANGIAYCLNNKFCKDKLHKIAEDKWSYPVVAEKYTNLYHKISGI